MTEPHVAKAGAYPLDLEPGTYWWCACGKSKTQPFCDGSHKGTGIEPIKYELAQAGKVYFCGCKHSAKKPFCDGTHKKFQP